MNADWNGKMRKEKNLEENVKRGKWVGKLNEDRNGKVGEMEMEVIMKRKKTGNGEGMKNQKKGRE